MKEIKYYDYELAYQGYKKVKKMLEQYGIEQVKDKFKDYCGYYDDNDMVEFYYEDYNVQITLRKEPTWYVSSEVIVVSYDGGEDCLKINDIGTLYKRKWKLLDYAIENEYTYEDIISEYESLKKLISELKITENILSDIAKIIAKINKIQETNFIEDLDYIKNHLCNAYNYKEIMKDCVEE